MQKNKYLIEEGLISFQANSHSIGVKKVLFCRGEEKTHLTQIAIGKLESNEEIPIHSHETMEEIFFILEGSGVFKVENNIFCVSMNNLIKIPPNTQHSIKAYTAMKFYYFGVETE